MIRPFNAATANETGDVGPELGGEARAGADTELGAPVAPVVVVELTVVDDWDDGGVEITAVSLTIDNKLTVASFNGETSKISAFSRTMTLRAERANCLVRTRFKTFPGVPMTTCAAMYGSGSTVMAKL